MALRSRLEFVLNNFRFFRIRKEMNIILQLLRKTKHALRIVFCCKNLFCDGAKFTQGQQGISCSLSVTAYTITGFYSFSSFILYLLLFLLTPTKALVLTTIMQINSITQQIHTVALTRTPTELIDTRLQT